MHSEEAGERTWPEVLDVAVVGGGVSGVYSAWRLLEGGAAAVPPKIVVFEGSQRVGGRLLSPTPPGMPHVRCELGGMRYESIHTLVRGLVENVFGLATEALPVAEPENIAYLRGHHLRQRDLTDPTRVPYALGWNERGVSPGALLVENALNQILPHATSATAEQWPELLRTATFDGRPLHEQGFWNLLARVLTHEGYMYAMDGSGYDCLTSNWNAADALPFLLADFSPKVTYSRIVKGFDRVPNLLADEVRKAGGEVRLGWKLRSFECATLPDRSTGVALRFEGHEEPVLARRLILAMPRRSLELLEPTGPLLSPANAEFRTLLASVLPIPLFKLFLCYEYPWWEAAGVTQGRSITDLPLRQCYYWGVDGRQPGADPSNHHAALLASYDDERFVSFWTGLREGDAARPYSARPTAHSHAHPGSEHWDEYSAPESMVLEAHRQLVELHGLPYAPEPYAAAYRDWTTDPFGGGVHFWAIHAKSWEVIPRMVHPMPELPVYVCGEAYSNQQGWVEGALETAERVLQDHFHLAPPVWAAPPVAAPANVEIAPASAANTRTR